MHDLECPWAWASRYRASTLDSKHTCVILEFCQHTFIHLQMIKISHIPTIAHVCTYMWIIYVYMYTSIYILYIYINISLRTKDLVKLDRFNEHVLLVKERTLLELIFTKAPLMQWTNAFYRQITANHSPNWLSSRALGINLYQFHCLQSPFTAAHSPWTSRQQPETSRETPLNHPWTTREPPVNHPWTTREPPVNHPWTTREPPVRPVC